MRMIIFQAFLLNLTGIVFHGCIPMENQLTGFQKGNVNLIYPTVYNKAHELELHSLVKIKNKFSENSREFNYISDVIKYCKENGIVRFEQKLKSRFLQKQSLCYWGLSDYSLFVK